VLHDLYQYALKNNLAARGGFKPKHVKAYILLSADGKFIGFDSVIEKTVVCPDIGSVALGTSKCNILTEKAAIVLLTDGAQNTLVKHQFFKNALKAGQKVESMFRVCLRALENESTLEQMQQALSTSKYTSKDVIGFKVDNCPVEQSTKYYDWWDTFRREQGSNAKKTGTAILQRCLITGELTEPMQTVTKISGLLAVGGHPSGDKLICFDKDAFCSYNLQKANNAVVSEEAMAAVNASLSTLIERGSTSSGAKLVHWYQQPLEDEYDICNLFNDDIKGSSTESIESYFASPLEEAKELRALRSAWKLIESAKSGEFPERLENMYFILSLSGAGGRIMIRSYLQGNYEDLYNSLCTWFDDLRIVTPSGKGMSKTPKIFAMNLRLLKFVKLSTKLSERMNKELAGIEPRILYSIFKNAPLPDSVANKALTYIRSKLFDADKDSKKEPIPDIVACQWLKVWLIRKQREQGEKITVNETCNKLNPSVAYQAGRMMAVFAAIQTEALGSDLGAGVIQRYYTSASTSPALVIGKLSALSQYHLSKIKNKSFARRYIDMLSEISVQIGANLPATLSLVEQSQFALGYYQQRAAIYQPKTEQSQNN
jgi:CRISPR-associated protein Csd1